MYVQCMFWWIKLSYLILSYLAMSPNLPNVAVSVAVATVFILFVLLCCGVLSDFFFLVLLRRGGASSSESGHTLIMGRSRLVRIKPSEVLSTCVSGIWAGTGVSSLRISKPDSGTNRKKNYHGQIYAAVSVDHMAN